MKQVTNSELENTKVFFGNGKDSLVVFLRDHKGKVFKELFFEVFNNLNNSILITARHIALIENACSHKGADMTILKLWAITPTQVEASKDLIRSLFLLNPPK